MVFNHVFLFVDNLKYWYRTLSEGGGSMRRSNCRLANMLTFIATATTAIVLLGLLLLGIGQHQSEHRGSVNQLKAQCHPLLRYDMIFSIIIHRLLWRGIPLTECTMPLFFHLYLSQNIYFYTYSIFD